LFFFIWLRMASGLTKVPCICSDENKEMCTGLLHVRDKNYTCYPATKTSEFKGHEAAGIFAKGNYELSPWKPRIAVKFNGDASGSVVTVTGAPSSVITEFPVGFFGEYPEGTKDPSVETFTFQFVDKYLKDCDEFQDYETVETDLNFYDGAKNIHVNVISEEDHSLLVEHGWGSFDVSLYQNFVTYNFTKRGKLSVFTVDPDFVCDPVTIRSLRCNPVITASGKIKNSDDFNPAFIQHEDPSKDLSGGAIVGITVACTFVLVAISTVLQILLKKKAESQLNATLPV